MAGIRRYTMAIHRVDGASEWAIQKTTTYDAGNPGSNPVGFAESPTAFDARLLTDATIISDGIGILVTLGFTAITFAGVKVRVTPTYTGTSRLLELWVLVSTGVLTRAAAQEIAVDENDGVASTKSRVFELWLDTPLADVRSFWVTYTNTAVTNGGFCALHLYESRAETTTSPFLASTGQPFTGTDYRPRAATVAGLSGKRYALALQLDRTPGSEDDAINTEGGWSVLDLAATACAQTTDEHGEDVVVVAMQNLATGAANSVLLLDWERFEDEYQYDALTPMYRRWGIGPIPSAPDALGAEESTYRYEPDRIKRFRTFEFELLADPTDATSVLRVSVQEDRVGSSARTQTYVTARRNQMQIMVRGLQFSVTVEHAGNEDFTPHWWKAIWDVLGPRLQLSTRG